jgi:hypothetical protein
VPLDTTKEATKVPEVAVERGTPSTWSIVSAWYTEHEAEGRLSGLAAVLFVLVAILTSGVCEWLVLIDLQRALGMLLAFRILLGAPTPNLVSTSAAGASGSAAASNEVRFEWQLIFLRVEEGHANDGIICDDDEMDDVEEDVDGERAPGEKVFVTMTLHCYRPACPHPPTHPLKLSCNHFYAS